MDLNGKGISSNDLGAIFAMFENRICAVDFCDRAAVTSLAQQDFCLNHFLVQCYENLDRIDPRSRRGNRVALDAATLREFVEECSRKALAACFKCQDLDNLQRGKLLDILLWAGELFVMLRTPRIGFPQPSYTEQDPLAARLAARQS